MTHNIPGSHPCSCSEYSSCFLKSALIDRRALVSPNRTKGVSSSKSISFNYLSAPILWGQKEGPQEAKCWILCL